MQANPRAGAHLLIVGGGPAARAILHTIAEQLARGVFKARIAAVTVVEAGAEFGSGAPWNRRDNLDLHLSSLPGAMSRVLYGERQARQFQQVVRMLRELGLRIDLLSGAEASDLEQAGAGYLLRLADGRVIEGEYVILGTGHGLRRDGPETPGWHPSPWPAARLQRRVLEDAGPHASRSVLVLGTYLSGVDTALTLAAGAGQFRPDRAGRQVYRGPARLSITLASRHGYLPKVWGPVNTRRRNAILTASALDKLGAGPSRRLTLAALMDLLVRELRANRAALAPSLDTSSVPALLASMHAMLARRTSAEWLDIDIREAARGNTAAWQDVLFAALPLISEHTHWLSSEEQRYFAQHVRSLFFNFVMPMAMDSACKLQALFASGDLEVLALGQHYCCTPEADSAGYILRSSDTRAPPRAFSDVVLAYDREADAPGAGFERALVARGLATRWGGGLQADPRTCALVAPAHEPAAARLFAMGPLLIGHFIDARSIGQLLRDAERIFNAIAASQQTQTQAPG